MSQVGVNCFFCHGKSGDSLSKEHLFSVPVCRGFGIDRSSEIMDPLDPSVAVRLDQVQVRIACRSCNGGWMRALEHRMEGVVADGWYRPRTTPLDPSTALVLKAWVLKSYLVWSAFAGKIRTFGRSGGTQWAVVPDATKARLLYEADWVGATSGVAFGLGRAEPSINLWGFGNPDVVPKGSRSPNARSAGALGLNLGELQLWVVNPLVPSASIRLPNGVIEVAAGLTLEELSMVAPIPDPGSVMVDNGSVAL